MIVGNLSDNSWVTASATYMNAQGKTANISNPKSAFACSPAILSPKRFCGDKFRSGFNLFLKSNYRLEASC